MSSEAALGFAAGSWALGLIHLSPQPSFPLRHKEPPKHRGVPMIHLEALPKKTWHGAYQDCLVLSKD